MTTTNGGIDVATIHNRTALDDVGCLGGRAFGPDDDHGLVPDDRPARGEVPLSVLVGERRQGTPEAREAVHRIALGLADRYGLDDALELAVSAADIAPFDPEICGVAALLRRRFDTTFGGIA